MVGRTLEGAQARGIPGVDPTDPLVTGQRQAMVLCNLHVTTPIPLGHLLASESFMLTAQECPGHAVSASSPRFLGWAGSEMLPALGELAGGAAALPLAGDVGAAFTPSAAMLNPFRLALLPENREGLNYEDLEPRFLPWSCRGHLSQHIVVKF